MFISLCFFCLCVNLVLINCFGLGWWVDRFVAWILACLLFWVGFWVILYLGVCLRLVPIAVVLVFALWLQVYVCCLFGLGLFDFGLFSYDCTGLSYDGFGFGFSICCNLSLSLLGFGI